MTGDSQERQRPSSGLLLVSAFACFAVVGCSEIRPEPDVEEGGLLESSTHEADALRRAEERQERNRGGGGGGGGY